MNKVALITGAASGIGRALAVALAQRGYAIAALDCREEGLATLAAQLGSEKRRCAWQVADVTQADALAEKVRLLEDAVGPTDLLVASAGIGIETSAADLKPADIARVINVNLTGVANSIAAVLPGMRQRRSGHLVAMSSVASFRGLPRMLAYSASKAGLNAFMEGLRVEAEPWGIHVTIVCPAWIRTPMTVDLHGRIPDMLEPQAAATQILHAIDRKRRYHAFPRSVTWKLRAIGWLPWSWQDALIRRMSRRMDAKQRAADESR